MSDVKSKASHRLLVAFLSFVMVFSMIPFSTMMANAATTNHSNAATVTVKNESGEAISGAKVTYTICDALSESVASGTDVATDSNGEVEIYTASIDSGTTLTLSSLMVTCDGYTTYESSSDADFNGEITSLNDNFTISMTSSSTEITDVTISAVDNLTHTGEAQALVEVTGTQEEDTVEYYLGDAETSTTEVPTATNAGTYSVKVVVKRTGYTDLEQIVETTINKADITDIDITAAENLKYDGENHALVTLTGEFLTEGAVTDTVTWTVNETNTESNDIPERMGVGNYTVTLTVDRGSNYNTFTKTVSVSIVLGDIDLDGLTITANDGTYDGTEQSLLTVTGAGDYTLQYSTDNQSNWSESIPTATDAGEYVIYVKATKENYNDNTSTGAFPITVTISKANQSFAFDNYTAGSSSEVTLSGKPPYSQAYNFSATDTASLAGGSITYSIEVDDEDISSINENGLLTVCYPGTIKITATLSGDDNYNECVIEYTLTVSAEVSSPGDFISFENSQVDYVIGTSETVANQTTSKTNNKIQGSIFYSLDTASGVSIDGSTGKVTVTDYEALAEAIRNADGSLELTVTATMTGSDGYGDDTASYAICVTFESTPDAPYTLPQVDGTDDWYITSVDVTPAGGYQIATAITDKFADSVAFSDQGTATRYVYLQNTETGGITDQIAINIKIDTVNPANLSIEFSELNLIQKVGQSLGFYNPTVTITFTAEDATSGIDHFDWTYTSESGDAVTGEISGSDITFSENTATATLTLPADEAEQLHGNISFTATDAASNNAGIRDDDYVFIVDTISPELSIKYQGEEAYEAQEAEYEGAHFFNSNVTVELTITETNFYSEDVVVKVSEDGGEATDVTVSWDGSVGTFTLEGDGDYIVYVTYTDKANNKMDDYVSDTITVDKTAPVVKISYTHDGDEQKTVFTVTEHNFRAGDVVITGTILDINENEVDFTADELTEILKDAEWTQSGDVYTYEYDGYIDGIYNLKMDYKDIAGWDADQFVADEFIIDHTAPTELTVEYVTTPWEIFLSVVTFGYYNPSVTVRFTAYDTTSGVESFTWGYTRESDASTVNYPASIADTTITAVQDKDDSSKFTAEITLTASEAAQYRGYLSVLATDVFQNESVKVVDNGNIIVVDTVAPEITVEYTEANRTVGTNYYYNDAIDIEFTVTEANFYEDDILITVTKDGVVFDYGTITWGNKNANDETVGTFTLPAPSDHSGDGDYVITVEYTDRSNNGMVTYVSDTHTIDTTLPVISVEYQNTTVANTLTDSDGNTREYYANTQTAVITINEHNFDSDEVEFTIVAKDVTGAELNAASLYSQSSWTVDSTGDIHTITITYPGDANYTFDVAYTDKATNAAKDYDPDYFTVDKTAPTNLTVSYSTSILDTVLESLTFGFYNAKMTVTLTAQDSTSRVYSFLYSYLNADGVSSVNAELIDEAIQASDITYSNDGKTATVTFEIPKLVLGSDNQFNGTVEFTATDRSGNESDTHEETKHVVVDNIAPTAQVSYNEATNVVGDISYYNGNITATITINEANFYSSDVQVMISNAGGTATAVTPAWSDSSADVHVGTFTLTEDGDYIITINYTDKSSNVMTTYTSEQMTIDTDIEAPTYTINGVAKTESGGAYADEAVVGFDFADQNFDTMTIELIRTRFDEVKDVTGDFIEVSDNDFGGSGSFTIPSEVENDGIYVLTITMTDKAGHTTESSLKFTINRYGSVYEYSDYLISVLEKQYIKIENGESEAITEDLVITEYNASQILTGSLNILITRDGEAIDTQYTSSPEVDDSADIGESGWYQYAYTIAKENFAEDGVYKITLTSAYAADDSDENESTSVPENSIDAAGNQILYAMDFTVDTTNPEIRNIVNLDKAIVNAQTLDVDYTVVDVGGLASIEVIVDGNTVDTITEFGDSVYNYSGSFTLSESSDAQTVRLVVTDIAGNVTDTASDDFSTNDLYTFNSIITVSTNFFVRWYANKSLFWGSIGGVVVLAGLIWFLIAFKRRKKEAKEA